MAHPLHHAESSARKFGGAPSDYQAIHDWFDASKEHLAIFTHRALRHHTQGIFEAERVFGLSLTNGAGREIPVRWIGEQHVREDCRGRIPSLTEVLYVGLDVSLEMTSICVVDANGGMILETKAVFYEWRRDRKGPPYLHLSSRSILYDRESVIEWAQSHEVK